MMSRLALFLVASLACTMNPSSANPVTRSERLAVRDIAAYLELDSRQQQALLSQLADFSRKWQELTRLAQAGHTGTEGSNPDIQASTVSTELCRQSQALQSAQRTQLRSLLTARQVDRLRQLEEAFSLLPTVESAQALGLMVDSLQLPPASLPTGSVTVATSWRRVAANPLPGCSAETRVLKEVELNGAGQPKTPERN
jgi:hypothetical protein